MSNPTCATCRWWKTGDTDPPDGNCHRYPPFEWDEEDMHWIWPFTDEDDWCGEWAANSGPSAKATAELSPSEDRCPKAQEGAPSRTFVDPHDYRQGTPFQRGDVSPGVP